CLANFKTTDIDGKVKSAAEIIYRSANDYKISPKYLLVLLQKEQSLIETAKPTQYQLDWATGFARCDDPVACAPEQVAEYQGFAKQVDRAAWRNRFYIDNAKNGWLKTTNTDYQIDGYKINPVNQATANLYNYTPHYNGNFNFWKIWNRYFSKNYPDGTLLQAGDGDIYLIENGIRRPFNNTAAFTSRGYTKEKVIVVSKNDLIKYDKGSAIKFPNYTLMRAPNQAVYLLIDNKKYKIISPEVLKKLGFISDEIVNLSSEEIDEYPDGTDITMETVYPLGALLMDKATGGVFYVENGVKNPIWAKEILKTNFAKEKVIKTTVEELNKFKTGAPVKFKDGELVKSKGQPAVYVISQGKLMPITSGQVFEALGYQWKNIIEMDGKILEKLHPLGERLDIGANEEAKSELTDGSLIKTASKAAVYLMENKTLRPFLSGKVFEDMGFKWKNIETVPEKNIALYSQGEPVDENYTKEA
ncbi:MAG: hypothetical protein V1860_03650, partial [bacterium]